MSSSKYCNELLTIMQENVCGTYTVCGNCPFIKYCDSMWDTMEKFFTFNKIEKKIDN